MKAQTAPAGNRELRVTIELEAAVVDSALKKAARTAARTITIPGFRSSKVPYRAIERYVGRSTLLADVQEELAGQALDQFLEGNPLGELEYTELENMQDDPVTYTFRLVLEPYVQLGVYSDLRVDPRDLELTEEDREQTISDLLENFTEFQRVEKAADWKDWVTLDVKSVVSDQERKLTGEVALAQEEWAFTLSKDDVSHPLSFQEKVIGMEPGQERSFEMVYPTKDVDADAGKLLQFEFKLKSVERRQRPEWNEDLLASAMEVAKGRGTLAEYEAAFWNRVRHTKAMQVFEDELAEAWAKLAEVSEIEFAQYSLDFQVEILIEKHLQALGYFDNEELDAYLDSSGQTLEEFRGSFEIEATAVLKQDLLLQEFTEKQQFDIPAEVQEHLEQRATEYASRMSNLSPEEGKRDAQEGFGRFFLELNRAEAQQEAARNAMLEIVTDGVHSLDSFYANSPDSKFEELIDVESEWMSDAET